MKDFLCLRKGLLIALIFLGPSSSRSALPLEYTGTPFRDPFYTAGAQVIPGRVECAYFDRGGEGIAYHDTDAVNHGTTIRLTFPVL